MDSFIRIVILISKNYTAEIILVIFTRILFEWYIAEILSKCTNLLIVVMSKLVWGKEKNEQNKGIRKYINQNIQNLFWNYLNNINFTLYYVLCFHKISGQTVRKQIRQQFHIWSCILCKYRFHERMFIFDKLISHFNEIRDRVT